MHRCEVKWSRAVRAGCPNQETEPKIKVSRGELNNKAPDPSTQDSPPATRAASVVLAQKYLVGRGSARIRGIGRKSFFECQTLAALEHTDIIPTCTHIYILLYVYISAWQSLAAPKAHNRMQNEGEVEAPGSPNNRRTYVDSGQGI